MALTVLDAGVVIAVLEATDVHHEAARAALAGAAADGDRFVLPVSAYAEVMVGPNRRGSEAVATVDGFVDALPATVEPATRAIAASAAALRSAHPRLRLPDALVVATASSIRADRILTTDAGWPKLGVPVEVVGTR